MSAALPVRKFYETSLGTYYKVNEEATVVHCTHGARLCCTSCRSNDCKHVAAVARFEREERAAA